MQPCNLAAPPTTRPDTYGIVLVSAERINNPDTKPTDIARQLALTLKSTNAAAKISYPAPAEYDPKTPFNGLFNYATSFILKSKDQKLLNRIKDVTKELLEGIRKQATDPIEPDKPLHKYTEKSLTTKDQINIDALNNPLGHNGKNGAYSKQASTTVPFNIQHGALDKITKTKGVGDSQENLLVRIGLRWQGDAPTDQQQETLRSILTKVLDNKNFPTITEGPNNLDINGEKKLPEPMERALDALLNLFYGEVSQDPSLNGINVKFRAEITRTKPVCGLDLKNPQGADQVTLKAKKTFTIAPPGQGEAV